MLVPVPSPRRTLLRPLLARQPQPALQPPQQRLHASPLIAPPKNVEHALADGHPALLRAPEPAQAVPSVHVLAHAEDGGDGALAGEVRPQEERQHDDDRDVCGEDVEVRLELDEQRGLRARVRVGAGARGAWDRDRSVHLDGLEERDERAEAVERLVHDFAREARLLLGRGRLRELPEEVVQRPSVRCYSRAARCKRRWARRAGRRKFEGETARWGRRGRGGEVLLGLLRLEYDCTHGGRGRWGRRGRTMSQRHHAVPDERDDKRSKSVLSVRRTDNTRQRAGVNGHDGLQRHNGGVGDRRLDRADCLPTSTGEGRRGWRHGFQSQEGRQQLALDACHERVDDSVDDRNEAFTNDPQALAPGVNLHPEADLIERL